MTIFPSTIFPQYVALELTYLAGRLPLLDKMDETSIVQFSFTKSGRGNWECDIYLPKRRQSLIEISCISLSNFENTDNALLASCLPRSDLEVPLGHSWIPYITTLYLRSENCVFVGGISLDLFVDSDTFWTGKKLLEDSVAGDFSKLSSNVSFLHLL